MQINASQLSAVESVWRTYSGVAVTLGIIGALMVLLCVLGFVAVVKQDLFLLRVVCVHTLHAPHLQFAVLLIVNIVLLLLLGLIVVVVYLVFQSNVQDQMNIKMVEAYWDNEQVRNATDFIQEQVCGRCM
jgi:hypothetical protein